MTGPNQIDAQRSRGVLVGDAGVQHNYFGTQHISWPIQIGRPPVLAHAYQLREELAAEVADRRKLTESIHTEIYVGDGGVGKTQFAAGRFAAESSTRDLRLWIDAATRSSIVSSYSHAYSILSGLAQFGEEPELHSKLFLGWLQSTQRRWLIVLDDLSDPADLHALWPAGAAGVTVITTRRRDAMLRGQGRSIFSVGVFSHEESRRYLSEKLDADSNPLFNAEDAARLADDLGHLPVALAQAAAVTIDQGWSCDRYRQIFAARAESLGRLFPADAAADEYDHTVSTAWILAVERAESLDATGFVRPVLDVASLLDPNGIPQAVWTTQAVSSYCLRRGQAPDPANAEMGPQVHRALRSLHRLSLVSHSSADWMHSVRIHALVQRVTVEQMSDPDFAAAANASSDALLEAWPDIEQDAELARVLRQNAASLYVRASSALINNAIHPLLHRYGTSLGEAGLIEQAAEYWEELAAKALVLLDSRNPDCLSARHEAIRWRAETGDPHTAVSKLEELVIDCDTALGPDADETLLSRHELGRWRGETGDVFGAAEAFALLYDDLSRIRGVESPATLAARHELAYHWGEAGDGVRAAAAFSDLVALRSRILGHDHPDTLAARHNEARWIGHSGQPLTAVRLFADLLEDRRRVLGPDHPATMRTEHNLANWRGLAGDVYGAIHALEEVLAHRIIVLGRRHPENLRTRLNLSRWRGEGGDPELALREFEELVRDHLAVLRPNSPQVLRVKSNLARFQGEAGDPASATASFTELVSEYERHLGESNPYTLRTRYHLARWLGESGDWLGAIALLTALLSDYLRLLGADNQYTLQVRRGLARWRGENGDAAEAVQELERLVGDYSALLGMRNPHTLRTRRSLARWRGEMGHATQAVLDLEAILADYLAILPRTSPSVLRTRHSLAHWRGVAGQVAEAATEFSGLLEDYVSIVGANSPYTYHLAGVLDHWRKTG